MIRLRRTAYATASRNDQISGAGIGVGTLSLVVASLILLVLAATGARAAQVTEFPLGSNDFSPEAITAGPEGAMWFTDTEGLGEGKVRTIGRVNEAGQVTKFALASSTANVLRAITYGADGNLWFAQGDGNIGRITPTGEFTEFPIAGSSYGIVAGPDGNLWFPETASVAEPWEKIVRMTPTGEMTRFPLPPTSFVRETIVVGPDGNLWFTDGNHIGRITTAGQITEFPLPNPLDVAAGIAAGPKGDIWFAERGAKAIGRISPTGAIQEFPLPKTANEGYYGRMVSGPDGRVWFTRTAGEIWRIDPSGRVAKIHLLRGATAPIDLAAGPNGDIWFTAWNGGPCEGGGSSCHSQPPGGPGIIGKIVPDPLTVKLVGKRAYAHGRWTKLKLACAEGNANEVCRGRLSLRAAVSPGSRRKIVIGQRSYALPVDTTRAIALRLSHKAWAFLSQGHHHLKAKATATLPNGRQVSTRVRLSYS